MMPPPSSDLVLVLDVGSSALKAALFDGDGAVRAQAEAGYATASPHPGWFEQAADDWAAAAARAIGLLGDLRGVAILALAGTMQNLIALDAEGRPLGPALLYSDGRAAARFADFAARMAAIDAAARVGNMVDPLWTAAKLDWLRAEQPARFERAAMLHAGAKDYLAWLLTGRHATDATTASTTGLMALATRQWDATILAALGVAPERLPVILPADAVLGGVTAAAAARFGLPAGLKVLNGSGDAGAATLGAGTAGAERAHVYLGSTGWVARSVIARHPRAPLPIYTLAHPDPGLLIEVAPILSAGDAAAWLADLLGPDTQDDDAGTIAPPLFLPYLKGERSPFHDAQVRGAFLGLDRAHGRASLRRAVLEGVALAIRHCIGELGGVAGALVALGGGAGNRTWMQIMADITQCPVAVHDAPVAATALGAAMLGARALGRAIPPPAPSALFEPRADSAEAASLRFRRYLAASDFLRAWARDVAFAPDGTAA